MCEERALRGTPESMKRCLVLVMRKGLRIRADHIQTMLDLATEIHLVTQEPEVVVGDPRFASCLRLPRNISHNEIVKATVQVAQAHGASAVITFNETDITIAGEANERIGVKWARAEADRISRDKFRQRSFLREYGIPSVWYYPVVDSTAALDVAKAHGFPLIVKPTRAASSVNVELVSDLDRLGNALEAIRELVGSGRGNYYDGIPENWAILEEYLPGQEVTLDAIVLNGQFILGGVHNKLTSSGPFFEEDLYTLPFTMPEREKELTQMARSITRHLEVDTTLFNAELRADANGNFRVVEFSTRISGGHVYRNIRDVYAIDLVRMFVRAACGESVESILAQENRRCPARMATCAKVIYTNGRVIRNSVGNAIYSPYFRAYYPLAEPGMSVACAPRGFDITGLLSVWMPWHSDQSPSVVHSVAYDLANKLDLEVEEVAD